MTAPHVAGVAALIKSLRPDLSALQVKDCIMIGVDKITTLNGGLTGKCVTGERLNAYKALVNAQNYTPDTIVAGDFNADGLDDIAYIVDAGSCVYGYKTLEIYVRLGGQNVTALWYQASMGQYDVAKIKFNVVIDRGRFF